jgi:hypothetical protein
MPQFLSDGYQQGKPAVNWYTKPTGGINALFARGAVNQATEGTEFTYLQNLESYREGSLIGMLGNVQLNTGVTDNTAILGIGEWVYSGGDLLIYGKASGNYYSMPVTGGPETLIASGKSTTAVPRFVNFQGYIIVFNGVDAPWQYNGTATNLTGTPAAWSTNKPYDADVLGARIFAVSKDGVFWCAAGNQNDWNTASDAGSFTNQFADASFPRAITALGSSLALFSVGNRVYSIDGTSPANFSVTRYSGNRTLTGVQAHAIFNRYLFYFTGNTIIPIYINDFGTKMIQEELDLGLKIKPMLTPIDPHMVIPQMDQTQLSSVILLPYYNKNYLLVYFKGTASSTYNYCLCYSLEQKSWTVRAMQPITAACAAENNVYTGTSTGQILKEFTGFTRADGQPIQMVLQTPWFDWNRPDLFKQINTLYLNFIYGISSNITINIYKDYSETAAISRTINNLKTYSPGKYGSSAYGVSSYGTNIIDFYLGELNINAKTLKLEVIVNDIVSDFELCGMGFEIELNDGH